MNSERSIDVIVVSDAKDNFFKSLTDQTITTAINNERNIKVNVIVVEKSHIVYPNTTTIKQDEPFNYNESLIKGADLGKSEYILFANNDLYFGFDWATELINAMEEHNSRSACPYSYISHVENKTDMTKHIPIYEGYRIKYEFCGWAFCWTRELYNKLSLDTRVSFWCSDDATAEQLKMSNEKHILVTASLVEHHDNGSKTLYSMSDPEIRELTNDQVLKFREIYKK